MLSLSADAFVCLLSLFLLLLNKLVLHDLVFMIEGSICCLTLLMVAGSVDMLSTLDLLSLLNLVLLYLTLLDSFVNFKLLVEFCKLKPLLQTIFVALVINQFRSLFLLHPQALVYLILDFLHVINFLGSVSELLVELLRELRVVWELFSEYFFDFLLQGKAESIVYINSNYARDNPLIPQPSNVQSHGL